MRTKEVSKTMPKTKRSDKGLNKNWKRFSTRKTLQNKNLNNIVKSIKFLRQGL